MPHAAGLYYEEHGRPDAPPLILSAGLGGVGAYWAPNIAGLARDHRVIAYDHRGTGRSDRALPDTVTVEDLANDILALSDALGLQCPHVVGHALGGLACLWLAHYGNERIGRVVAVNSWMKIDRHTARCFDLRLAILRGAGLRTFIETQPLFLYPASWISENLDALDAEVPAQVASFQGVENLEKRIAAARAFDVVDAMSSPSWPILALAARDDMLVPAFCTEQMTIDGSPREVRIIPWGGHGCNVTVPGDFNRIVLGWLAC